MGTDLEARIEAVGKEIARQNDRIISFVRSLPDSSTFRNAGYMLVIEIITRLISQEEDWAKFRNATEAVTVAEKVMKLIEGYEVKDIISEANKIDDPAVRRELFEEFKRKAQAAQR